MLKIKKIELNLVGTKRKFFLLLFGYQLSFLQVFFITPAVLLFFAALIIIVTIIQDSGGQVYTGRFLYILFLGDEGYFDGSRVVGIYLTYVFISTFLIEVFNGVFRKKIAISLKLKLKVVLGFFLVTYSMIALWFLVKNGFSDSLVIVVFLFFSLLSGAVGISISHLLGIIKNAIKNLEVDFKNNKEL